MLFGAKSTHHNHGKKKGNKKTTRLHCRVFVSYYTKIGEKTSEVVALGELLSTENAALLHRSFISPNRNLAMFY